MKGGDRLPLIIIALKSPYLLLIVRNLMIMQKKTPKASFLKVKVMFCEFVGDF